MNTRSPLPARQSLLYWECPGGALVGSLVASLVACLVMPMVSSTRSTQSGEISHDLPHRNLRFWFRFVQKWLFRWRFGRLLPYPARLKHTYILGKSGAGKSELLKLFIYHDIQHGAGVFVLDPHGDLIKECARLSLFQRKYRDKLVYISPKYADHHYTPRYNPLQHPYHDKPEMQRRTAIGVRAGELMAGFETLFRGEFTEHMQLLLKYAMMLLMEYPGTTLFDLLRLITPVPEVDERKGETSVVSPFLQRVESHWDAELREYFKTTFRETQTRHTRNGVLVRLKNAFYNPYLKTMFDTEQSSFDVTGLLNAGKVVLVNASEGLIGQEGANVFGAFLVAELTSYAFSRATVHQHERTPIFVYVDECQNFLTHNIEKLLSGGRKYGLHLVLANQHLGQFSGDGLTVVKKSILANTDVKLCGKASNEDKRAMSNEMELDTPAQLKEIKQSQFAVKAGDRRPLKVSFQDFFGAPTETPG